MNPRRRRSQQCNHGDEVIVRVANLLMTLALDFENSHLAEILRHRQQVMLEQTPSVDPRQLPLFPDLPPF